MLVKLLQKKQNESICNYVTQIPPFATALGSHIYLYIQGKCYFRHQTSSALFAWLATITMDKYECVLNIDACILVYAEPKKQSCI